jgi:hypothetical protein
LKEEAMLRNAGVLCALTAACIWSGCSGDGGGGFEPIESVEIDPSEAAVEIGYSLSLEATVTGGADKSLDWFVNDIEDGNSVFGTISRNSPVTYTAPDSVPSPATVVIRAVSVEDTTVSDTCLITVTFNILHVDPVAGSDVVGTGFVGNPLRSITNASDLSESGMTILAGPGVYGEANGETFPISLKGGVALEGVNWETCVIRGSNPMRAAVTLSSDDCSLRRFTFEATADLGPDRWEHYVNIRGTNVVIDSIRSTDRAYLSCIRIRQSSDVMVENCSFVVPYPASPPPNSGSNRAFEIIQGNDGTVIRKCTVSGFWEGLRITDTCDALFSGCIIENNSVGVYLCCHESATSNPNPDFGGGARGSAGGNTISGNVECGLVNTTYNVIFARNNTWGHSPPVEGEDYCNTSTGSVLAQ